MKKVALVVALILSVALPASAAQKNKKTTTVYGSDNAAVDRTNIQAAIDAAGKGHTVELVGTFQLDGHAIWIQRGDITIAGREIDNDNDGSLNEDWTDGVDNDGDGSIDEDGWDAVINGVASGDGGPDALPWNQYNRGIRIEGLSGTERNVVVQGIEFSTLTRGVVFAADINFPDDFSCDGVVNTSGEIRNSTVRRNHFTNSIRGAQVFGASDHMTFSDNLATNMRPAQGATSLSSYGFLVFGGESGCINGDGSFGSVFVERPRRTKVVDNTVIGSVWAGIGGFDAPDMTVQGNTLDGQGALRWGVILGEGSTDGHILHNTISNFDRGPTVGSTGARVQNNTVENAYSAFILYAEASDNLFVNNTATNAVFEAYLLLDLTFDNMIRLNGNNDISEVVDLGTDNSIKK